MVSYILLTVEAVERVVWEKIRERLSITVSQCKIYSDHPFATPLPGLFPLPFSSSAATFAALTSGSHMPKINFLEQLCNDSLITLSVSQMEKNTDWIHFTRCLYCLQRIRDSTVPSILAKQNFTGCGGVRKTVIFGFMGKCCSLFPPGLTSVMRE